MLYTCVARSIYYFIIAIRLVFFFHPLRGNARVQKSGAIWSDRTFRRGTSTSALEVISLFIPLINKELSTFSHEPTFQEYG